jgi:hypothetical protein
MSNSFECGDTLGLPSSPAGYVCNATVPVSGPTNNYYVRCADQPWLDDISERNVNSQSYVYTLRQPSEKISIKKIAPEFDFEINTDMTTIELKVETVNGGDYHYCSYSFSGYENMIKMFETGESTVHIQSLNRPAGRQKLYIKCNDETWDYAQGMTEFEIIKDTSSPQVARAWQSGGKIYFITVEDSECRYSTSNCNFAWDNAEFAGSGKQHTIDSTKGETYYIKCKDDFGNVPTGCSIEVQSL